MNLKTLSKLSVVLLSVPLVALAGAKFTRPINMQTYSDGSGSAAGSVGDVRSSADSTQAIGCYVTATLTRTGRCYARTVPSTLYPSGLYRSCTIPSSAAAMFDAAARVSSDSYVYFKWDPDGICTSIHVVNGSEFAPKEQ